MSGTRNASQSCASIRLVRLQVNSGVVNVQAATDGVLFIYRSSFGVWALPHRRLACLPGAVSVPTLSW